jgi:hypothetical protein
MCDCGLHTRSAPSQPAKLSAPHRKGWDIFIRQAVQPVLNPSCRAAPSSLPVPPHSSLRYFLLMATASSHQDLSLTTFAVR